MTPQLSEQEKREIKERFSQLGATPSVLSIVDTLTREQACDLLFFLAHCALAYANEQLKKENLP